MYRFPFWPLRNIVYARPGGVALVLDAYLPRGPGPHPAALVIHGGSWRMGSKAQLAPTAWLLARAGIAAFAINYRLAPAHRWPAQRRDTETALRWLHLHAARYRVDPRRIGAFGYSAGGQLAAFLGVAPPGLDAGDTGEPLRLQAVVCGGASCDLQTVRLDARWPVSWLGGTRRERPDVFRSASPIAFVEAGAPPMLFFHGTRDRMVRIDEPVRMVRKLRDAGNEASLLKLCGMGHLGAAVHPRAIYRSIRFLRSRLGLVRP